MVNLVIVADDFTGALDTGVQFAKNSIRTMVLLYRDLDFKVIEDNIEVLVVDTESRHISEQEAAKRVREVGIKASRQGVSYFYKKTDSVMRGNIGSELYALMEGIGSNEIMFIPAYPDAKRTTVNGSQFVDDVPIDETSFAKDPIDPVHFCYIPSLIQSQVDVNTVVVKKKQFENFSFIDQMERTVYIFDAEDNMELNRIAQRLKEKGKLRSTAGCAGFANTLLGVLDLSKFHRDIRKRDYSNMLVVCGSLNEISLRQVKHAESHGFYSFTLSSIQKLDRGYFQSPKGEALIQEVVEMLNSGRDVIIKTVDDSGDEEACKYCAKQFRVDQNEIPYVITQNIAQLVRKISEQKELETLVVFGGDTTLEIVNALGLDGVAPQEEMMTGVVLSETVGKAMKMNLVSKSGGFGEEDVLVRIKEYLSVLDHVSSQ